MSRRVPPIPQSHPISLFKYFAEEEHALALINHGKLLLRTLASFRAFENDSARGDPDDAVLQYKPAEGLEITKTETGKTFRMHRTFRSSVKADQIFVYCLSTELSEHIAERFGSRFCVEIPSLRLINSIRRAVRLRSGFDRKIYAGPVEYRRGDQPPKVDWALPERISFMKDQHWDYQKEYRIIAGKKGSLGVENVELTLQDGPAPNQPPTSETLNLTLGSFTKHAKLHKLKAELRR